jgi:signal transduction histidine kinase
VLLIKTLRSSTLKLAFLYVTGFSSAIFAVLGYVYWNTSVFVGARADRAIAVERAALLEAYAGSGQGGLAAMIGRRIADPFFAEWRYLLADPRYRYVAGNLRLWPAALGGNSGWADVTDPGGPRSSPLRVTYLTLPGKYRLLVGRKLGDIGQFRQMIAVGLGSAGGLFLLLAAAAGISTSRRSVARIEAINATSRRIIDTGLRERIPLRGTRDEWDELAENLNRMLDRIEELVESNRQVSDNVAHDLRTPLTRMRGRLERAHRQPLDRMQYRVVIGDAMAELDAILRTFASLLRIAQIEARDRTAGFRPVDLAALAREVAELFDPAAEEQHVTLRLRLADRIVAVGDRDLLFDALANLVDNAIRHGGRGEVRLEAGSGGEGPFLAVADRGPGIACEERRPVLQRFYRLERSRNSPGNGLGLSLVAAVAKLHGAALDLADNSPGLRIELRFPVPPRHHDQNMVQR